MRLRLILSSAAVTLAVSAPLGAWAQASERGNTYVAPAHDQAFDAAMAEARRTLPLFWAKWRAKPAGYSAFRLKAGLRTDDGRGHEYLWLEPLAVDADGTIRGKLSDDAVAIRGLKVGMSVKVRPADVGDWMYVKDRKMYGQYTLRVELSRAPPDQRAQYLALLSPAPLEPGDH